MAVAKKLPWYVTAGYLVGLSGILFGQRLFAHVDGVSTFFTLIGVALMVCATFLRAWSYLNTKGDNRQVEKITLLTYVGGLVAMGLFALTTEWGIGLFGMSDAEPQEITRLVVPLQVLWAIVLACSLLPLMLISQGQVGTSAAAKIATLLAPIVPVVALILFLVRILMGRQYRSRDAESYDEDFVDSFRIRQLGTSGLTIALAMSFLMVTCQIANERDIKKDVSYFKTSQVGTATANIVSSLNEPVEVILFYPDVNEVKEEVKSYFKDLANKTGKIDLKSYDHKTERALAEKYKVSSDGTIVIARGDKHEKFTISDDMKKARGRQLRTLDATVQKTMMKVVRAKRIAYLTTGHGELNDPKSAGVLGARMAGRMQVSKLRSLLQLLNYQVKNLSAFDLTGGVPEDATMVISLAPLRSFTEQEEEAFDEYLGQGGAVLLTLDPNGQAELGPTLQGRLGVNYVNTALADDKEFVPQRRNRADHAFMKTNQFSSHASVTTLSRQGAAAGILLIRPGYLEEVKFAEGRKTKRTFVVRSMSSAFADLNQNFLFDSGAEKRKRYNIAVAVEDVAAKKKEPKKEGEDVQPREGMRAMVIADAELFTDLVLGNVPLLQNLLFDSFNWLGGEEQFRGDTKNEEDKKIEHTKSEDAWRFWGSIGGVPTLVLVIGGIFIRRRRGSRRAS